MSFEWKRWQCMARLISFDSICSRTYGCGTYTGWGAGAILSPSEEAEISPLGHMAMKMPVNIKLVKLMLIGRSFGVLPQCIVMAAALSVQDVFSLPSPIFIKYISRSLTFPTFTPALWNVPSFPPVFDFKSALLLRFIAWIIPLCSAARIQISKMWRHVLALHWSWDPEHDGAVMR